MIALGSGVGLVAPAAPTAAAGEGPDCNLVRSNDTTPVTGTNDPYDRLRIAAAQEIVGGTGSAARRQAGRGVDVVVVDAGFAFGADTATDAPGYRGVGDLAIPHAQVVAGIIGSPDQPERKSEASVPIGFAPGVRLHSVRVYEAVRSSADTSSTEVAPPDAAVLASGLDQVAQRVRSGRLGKRTIVVVPFVVGRTAALAAAIKRVQGAGALVIASAGDRPTEATGSPLDRFVGDDGPQFGQDAAGLAWPAAAPGVLAVGVAPDEVPTQGDAPSLLLPNSDIDLVAPVLGGVSIGDSGRACRISNPSADWASAAVAGVAALVWARHDVSSTALRARLEHTADGAGESAGPHAGYGVVQPLSALERRAGSWERADEDAESDRQTRAIAPEPAADVLAETRRRTLWWGLIGGGLLAVALVLRPLRRRP